MAQEPMNDAKRPATVLSKKNLSKLATHEDPYHLHKTLGILSLLHFFYRYLYVLPTTGTLGFEGTKFDWLAMCTHLALSSSSLIFHVVKSRMLKFPMIMWNEYRLHAIVFTLRCFSVFALGYATDPRVSPSLASFATSIPGRFCVFAAVLAHHVLADLITHWYGTAGITAVRVKKSTRTGKIQFAGVKMLYSFYQFLAIASHVFVSSSDPTKRHFTMDLGFNTLVAIQSSAFLMTLCRKNIITFRTHGVIYSICLILSSGYIIRSMLYHSFHQCAFLFSATILVFGLRVRFRLDKYLLWALFTLCTAPQIGVPAAIATAYTQILAHSAVARAVHQIGSLVVQEMFFTYTQLGCLVFMLGAMGLVSNHMREKTTSERKGFVSALVQGLSERAGALANKAKEGLGIDTGKGTSMFF